MTIIAIFMKSAERKGLSVKATMRRLIIEKIQMSNSNLEKLKFFLELAGVVTFYQITARNSLEP